MGMKAWKKYQHGFLWVIAVVSLAAATVLRIYFLLEGKKEYERRKKEEEELDK
jgi:hypothetical protein